MEPDLNAAAPGSSLFSPSTETKFRPDIQGLRAIAVIAVLLYHAGVPIVSGGYVGVDVFFVISGFLITAHLLSGLAANGRVKFGEFYAKRARRILPASFVVILASLAIALAIYPPLLADSIERAAIATSLYVPNWYFALERTDYLAGSTPSIFQHYWSLGIEEQFYLLWPLLLGLLWLVFRGGRIRMLIGTSVFVLASFAAGVVLTSMSQPLAFFSLPTRAWELGVGALLAIVLTIRPAPLRGPLAAVVGWVGIASIVGSIVLFSSATVFPGTMAAIPVVSTALVILAGVQAPRFGPSRALSLRAMQFVGLISYSLYLVHWPMLQIPAALSGFSRETPLWLGLLIVAAAVPVAWLLYRFVENPARRMPVLAGARARRTLVATVLVSVLAVGASLGVGQLLGRAPLQTDAVADAAVLTDPPVFTPTVPSNLTPALADSADDIAVAYGDGCHQNNDSVDAEGCIYGDPDAPRIVLFGDSHAVQWLPALEIIAQEQGVAIQLFSKSACPAASVTVLQRGASPYWQCTDWRDAVLETIAADPPDLVLISSWGQHPIEGADAGAAWTTGLEQTLDRLGSEVVILADTPYVGFDVPTCLSSFLADTSRCGVARDDAFDAAALQAERSVAAAAGVEIIDFTDLLCDEQRCDPIIGDALVYRDADHLTAHMVRLLVPELQERLAPYLAAMTR